jgi:dUTP pyrophosphatase
LRLRFQRLAQNALAPARAHEDDAAFDLHSAEELVIQPGERADVGTALAVAIPPAHAGLVLPRSGLAARHGISLVNAPGLIDPGYRGELRVLLINTDRHEPFEIAPGDRIAQLMVVATGVVRLHEVDELDETVRGLGGFGSTGR